LNVNVKKANKTGGNIIISSFVMEKLLLNITKVIKRKRIIWTCLTRSWEEW
jgi:hypothetical protein